MDVGLCRPGDPSARPAPPGDPSVACSSSATGAFAGYFNANALRPRAVRNSKKLHIPLDIHAGVPSLQACILVHKRQGNEGNARHAHEHTQHTRPHLMMPRVVEMSTVGVRLRRESSRSHERCQRQTPAVPGARSWWHLPRRVRRLSPSDAPSPKPVKIIFLTLRTCSCWPGGLPAHVAKNVLHAAQSWTTFARWYPHHHQRRVRTCAKPSIGYPNSLGV